MRPCTVVAPGRVTILAAMSEQDFELDRATRLEPLGDGRYGAQLTDAWAVFGAPNGGFLSALAAKAMRAASQAHPDPLTMSAQFAGRAELGPCEVHVETLRSGRTSTSMLARLVQGDRTFAVFTSSFGDLDAQTGPTLEEAPPIPVPDPDACTPAPQIPGMTPVFTQRFDLRYAPEAATWLTGRRTDKLVMGGCCRLVDRRPLDALAALLIADTYPPNTFNTFGPNGWVPTLQLTTYLRRRPVGTWLRVWVRSRAMIDGLLDEDAWLWDETGQLVAQARQLAVYRAR